MGSCYSSRLEGITSKCVSSGTVISILEDHEALIRAANKDTNWLLIGMEAELTEYLFFKGHKLLEESELCQGMIDFELQLYDTDYSDLIDSLYEDGFENIKIVSIVQSLITRTIEKAENSSLYADTTEIVVVGRYPKGIGQFFNGKQVMEKRGFRYNE